MALPFFGSFTTLAATQTGPALPIYINAGSPIEYKAPDGTIYSADQPWSLVTLVGYEGGEPVSTGMPIQGVNERLVDAKLYSTQRRGWRAYRFSALPDGDYVVTLHFAEPAAHGAGLSIFDVSINNQLVLDDFDPVAVAGMEYAIVQRFAVSVTNNDLIVQAIPQVGQIHLAAIAVEASEPDETAPPAPTQVAATASFESSILSWAPQSAPDLAGYLVYRAATAAGPFALLTATPQPLDRYIDRFDTQPISTTWPITTTSPITGTSPIIGTSSLTTTSTLTGTPPLTGTSPRPVAQPLFATLAVTDSLPSETTWHYQVRAVDLYGNASEASTAVSVRPLAIAGSALPAYQISVAPVDLQTIYQNVQQDIEVPAELLFEGTSYAIRLRLRGNFSREFAKKSWEVIFTGKSPLADRARLNLKSHYDDPSLMRGVLTTRIYERMGIAPPSARHSLLFINGEYMGLYTDYEQVNEDFLRRTGRALGSTIYRTNFTALGNYGDLLANEADYAQMYTIKTNDHVGYAPLIELVKQVNTTPRQSLPSRLYDVLKVARYLDYYAAVIFTGNMDFTRHNVYLIQDAASRQWEIVPWDPDFTWGYAAPFTEYMEVRQPINMGTVENPFVVQGPNQILSKTLATRPYRAYFCSRLAELVSDEFVNNTVNPLIDRTYRSIEVAGQADWHKIGREQNAKFATSPLRLKEYATKRVAFLQEQMASYCPVEPSFLKINELMAQNLTSTCDPDEPESAACHDDWIEIYNPGLTAVDLAGYYLSNEPSDPMRHRIAQSIVIQPLEHVLIWADGEPHQGANHASFQLGEVNQTITLYAPDGTTLVDVLQVATAEADQTTGRYPDGTLASYVLPLASPNQPNLLGILFDQLTKEPTTPADDSAVTVQVVYRSAEGLAGSTLYYRLENGTLDQVPMMEVTPTHFTAQIPRQPNGDRVDYFVRAKSTGGISVSSPPNAPDETYSYVVGYTPPALFINEVAAGYIEPNGAGTPEADSWIEIYNAGTATEQLGGMYLSNDPTQAQMYRIPNGIALPAGGYLRFYATNLPDDGPLYTNFMLAPEGGFVGLYAGDSEKNLLIHGVYLGQQSGAETYQRCPNQPAFWALTTLATPEMENQPDCLFNFLPIGRK